MDRKSKRIFAALLSVAMCLSMLAGCGGDTGGGANDNDVSGHETVGIGSSDSEQPQSSVTPSTELKEPPQEEQILADVNSYQYSVLPESSTITGLEVVKRQTNLEDKEDIIYCRLTGPENGFMYSQYYVRLLYNFYDEGGWILDEMAADQQDLWGPIGYLDSEGNPIEDGLVFIGREVLPANISPGGVGGSDDDDEDEGPKYVAPPTGERDSSIIINNEGMWHSYGVVSDMLGNEVAGLTGTSNANRATVVEDGLVYLCDLSGTKLSSGYEEVSYAGTLTDDAGAVIDHRWRVCRDGLLGFLNDQGQEVVPLIYDAAYNAKASFILDGEELIELCIVYDGDESCIINAYGQELYRFIDVEGFRVELCKKGFLILKDTNDGNMSYHMTGYDRNGSELFSGTYDIVCWNNAGVCGWHRDFGGWDIFNWQGEQDHLSDREETLWALWPLFENKTLYNYYFAWHDDADDCLYHITGPVSSDTYVVKESRFNNFAYGSYCIDWNGGVFDLDGNYIIPPRYQYVTAVGGGLFIVRNTDDKEALFDLQGNQRTQFFDDIRTYSENGRYFIVQLDTKLYAMKSPLSEEEIMASPECNSLFVSKMTG